MILLSLILVIALERVISASPMLTSLFYYKKYRTIAAGHVAFEQPEKAKTHLLVWLMLPTAIVAYGQYALGQGLLGLAFSAFILLVCFGCPHHRALYKQYLSSASRGDGQACDNFSQKLGQKLCSETGNCLETLGQTLVWINFRHYLAVIFWFVVAGPAGAVFYVLARNFEVECRSDSELQHCQKANQHLMAVLDWLPARVAGFAYLFVGNFSNALPLWFRYLLDSKVSARDLVTHVAIAAEEVKAPDEDCLSEPCMLVKLAKRTVIFSLALVAVLTLAGILN